MSSAVPSPATVLEAVKKLAPTGAPVTTTEVAAKFDCTARTVYNKLELLVDEGALETKKVGARGRVWWRASEQSSVDSPDAPRADSSASLSRLRERQDEFNTAVESPSREHLYNVIFNQTFQFIGVLEPDGTIIDANEAALSFGGLTRDDVFGRPFWEAYWWQISEQTQVQLRDAIERAADGEFVRYDVEVQGADRNVIIDFSLRPVTNEDDEVILIVPEGRDITTLKEHEQHLQRVDQLNNVIRTIVQTIARVETREEIAEAVCETLLEFDAYQAAVMGELSPAFDDFESWAMTGGIEAILAGVVDTEAPPLSETISASAVQTGEFHVRHNLSEIPYDYWQQLAATHGIQSYAAIPLVFQKAAYGVLVVYADRPAAFDEEKQRILTELGEIIGYALYALERKEVLNPTVELKFQSTQLAQAFRTETDKDFTVTLDSIVPLPNGRTQQFWTATGLSTQTFRTVLANRFPGISELKLLEKAGEMARFRVNATDKSTGAIFDAFDGQLKSATIQDETAIIIGTFPVVVDSTAIAQALGKKYPDIELVAKRRLLTPNYLRQLVDDELTKRQQTVLRLAYFGGYYEQPRLSTGDELAAELSISRQTFHHHLRNAEATVFYHLLEQATASL
jgi:PAS domain S-box-containing protein